MLGQYLAGCLTSSLLGAENKIKIPPYLILLIVMTVAGILISEGLLAFCSYQYFLNSVGLSEIAAALYTLVIAVILIVLLMVYINFTIKKLSAANSISKGYDAFKGVIAAFAKGFQNR